jgi:Tfp pilus assembly ATPase PilU
MQLMDISLLDLYKQGKISAEDAYLKARNKADFEDLAGAKKEAPPAGNIAAPQNTVVKEKAP